MPVTDSIRRRPLLWLFFLAFAMALAFQGSRGLWDPDEGRYTNVSLQILRTGDPITLYRHHDSLHFTKPPITYWAMAASMKAFGRNEWAARLPMAIAFAFTVFLVARMGRVFVPERPWLPGVIYLGSLFPYFAANTINTDSMLAAMEALAVYCYVQARFAGGSPRWINAMWAAFGLAFMTKGPPSLLPLLVIVLFNWRHGVGLKLLRPFGLLAFALIGLSWYVAVIILHPGLLDYFLGHEVVARIASAELDRHPEWYGPLMIYLPTLALGLLPWWPMAVWRARASSFASSNLPLVNNEHKRFLWFWVLIPLLVLSLSRSRLPLYVLPLFAPLALLMGRALALHLKSTRAWLLIGLWLVLIVALKGLIAQNLPGNNDLVDGLRRNSMRNLAAELRPLLPGPATEIIFIEDKTRYGLHLYLGAEVARVSFKRFPKAISAANFDKTLGDSLREKQQGRVYFFKRPNTDYFLNDVRAAGKQPVLLGVLTDAKGRADQDRMIYTLEGDFPAR